MGGPNLEVFKFGMYIFFPIGWMYYFGTNLDQRFHVPDFWPGKNETHTIPFEREEIGEELARLRAKRLEGRARRLAVQQEMGGSEAVEQGVREGVIAERVRDLGGEGGSPFLKTLGNAEHTEARPGAVNVEEKQQGGKGWFHFW